jgi:tripartite-type tricarboxylate transporter receptor subunit TctC
MPAHPRFHRLAIALVIACTGGWAGAASAQAAYPNKPITMIVPGPPGGSGDIVARIIGKEMSDALKQPVIIDNRPGGGGIIGAQAMLRAAPDGYTIMMGNTGPNAINYSLYRQLPYKPQDFAGITDVLSFPNVLSVRADSPIKSVKDLVAAAKAAPGRTTFASSGPGQTTHLSGQLFGLATGTELVHVPYKGANLGLQAVMSGEVDFMFDNFPSLQGQLRGGRVRALAVTSAERVPQLPDVPTLKEAGLEGLQITGWFGLVARSNIPPNIRDQLYKTVSTILQREDMKEKFRQLGGSVGGSTPVDFDAFMLAETKKWGAAIKAAGVTLDQ